MIAARTKAALAAARGGSLGGPKLAEPREAATASIKALADRHAANVLPIIRAVQRTGAVSLHQIADALNARGISTPRGGLTRSRGAMCWRGRRAFLPRRGNGPGEATHSHSSCLNRFVL